MNTKMFNSNENEPLSTHTGAPFLYLARRALAAEEVLTYLLER